MNDVFHSLSKQEYEITNPRAFGYTSSLDNALSCLVIISNVAPYKSNVFRGKSSHGVDKYINKLSRGLTEFPELFLHTPVSIDQKNGIG